MKTICFQLVSMDYLRILLLFSFAFILSSCSRLPNPGDGSLWERKQRKEALGLNRIHDSETFKADIANNLLGMQPPPDGRRRIDDTKVPEIIFKIYDSSINRTTGAPLSKRSAYRGEVDLVRGLEDLYDVNTQTRMNFMFDTSHINSTEDIIEAEFHVYKRVLQRSSNPQMHDVELELFLVEKANWTLQGSIYGLKLLEKKIMSAHADEWVPFKTLKEVVKHWINNPYSNRGLLLRATDPISHGSMNGSHIDFIQKGEHPLDKQPVLVLFSDKVKKKQGKTRRKTQKAIRDQINNLLNEQPVIPHHDKGDANSDIHLLNRKKRDIYQSSPRGNEHPVSDEGTPTHCRKKEMFVSISALGWSNWILYPEWLTVNSCVGTCRYPPGSNIPHTNHAILLSLVNHFEPDKVKAPCCVPNQLTPLSILYADNSDVVTIRQYENMHVSSCGCR